jgi:hypothetical protein
MKLHFSYRSNNARHPLRCNPTRDEPKLSTIVFKLEKWYLALISSKAKPSFSKLGFGEQGSKGTS